jgi:hypothetical protein
MKWLIHFIKTIFGMLEPPIFNDFDITVRVKHGGGIVKLVGHHYSVELGTYMYWVNVNGVLVVIPETYLQQI